ncbi:hypothetical protein BDF21DRAFT_406618 [Thamnidium elegans]|nr:hypothetical protein BDF21DRAFT_406618 [Thamnidium elegans]
MTLQFCDLLKKVMSMAGFQHTPHPGYLFLFLFRKLTDLIDLLNWIFVVIATLAEILGFANNFICSIKWFLIFRNVDFPCVSVNSFFARTSKSYFLLIIIVTSA